MYWGGHAAVLRLDEVTFVDMPFKRCNGEEIYARRQALLLQNNSALADSAEISHGLKYVAFTRLYDTFYLLTNFEY